MSKIKIFALGGLNENGKNLYVLEIDKNIFILDCGLKYADEHTLGIDYILPNIDYLKDKVDRIKGIFITHSHDENSGAIVDLYPYFDGVKIYGSRFTINVIKKELELEGKNTSNLVELLPHKSITIENIKIFPVNLSHSTPGNFGYAFYTSDGVIFYASDFVFDPMMKGAYKTDIGKLAYIGKQKVLCLLAESVYASNVGFTTPKHRIYNLIRETLNTAPNRIIFNVLNSHLYRIQELFNEVSKTDRKVVIMGKRLQNIINDAVSDKYLYVNKGIIGDLSNINDKNVVILNSNEREKPYYNMTKIAGGYDKFIKLTETDTVFLATPVYEGQEKTFSALLDEIAKIGSNVVVLDSKKHLSHHASREDLMLMLDLIKPKYYFPVRGEYRRQVANAEVASEVGIPNDCILLKENGDVVTIIDGNLVDNYEKVPSGAIQIDGDSSDDIGQVVLKDRELLSDNGIMIVSATLNKKNKQIIAGPEILTRGFVYVKDSVELINEIKSMCTKIIIDNIHSNYVEYTKVKNSIREELSKFLINQTGNKPMIITVIQEIDI